ncbi:MAG: cardiolipin synthase [Clostridia bacterium]|nr:cardiolipin synthase [Clostridia bacterium]
MKRTYTYKAGNKTIERQVNYIPFRYILAFMVTIFEVLAIIATVVVLCYFVPYFYILAWLTQIGCVISIIASNDNPDYKIPWLLFVLIIPIGGFMLYLIFYSRKLPKRLILRLESLNKYGFQKDDTPQMESLQTQDPQAYAQARLLNATASATLFENTRLSYYPLGEELMESMLKDLRTAEKFIYMEYFIIEEGYFWDSILGILKEKATQGVEIKVIYDDVGCMSTLPGNYAKILKTYGIEGVPFSRLKGQADNEFNNRSHRKITVIDGKIGYTGGVNIADEYINRIERFGHWKDVGIRLEGDAVWELTRLFVTDFGINVKKDPVFNSELYPKSQIIDTGWVIPFGDGPKPLYEKRVAKSLITQMLFSAKESAYLVTPYFIIDNELCQCIESTALRGVNVTLIVPHIPDKKLVFNMTRSFYPRLLRAGVRIFEYTPGFVHAKMYLVDGKTAFIGTVNLDYRSLVHHFENGVWLHSCPVTKEIEKDILSTLEKCEKVTEKSLKRGLLLRFMQSVVKIFAPLL